MIARDTNTRAINHIESRYLKKSSNRIMVACEDLNFVWSEKEVRDFRYLWRNDAPITDIADYFKRTHEEVAILIFDQALKGFVGPREGGLV
ncbi:MAG: helix-turn-helix domain containing protein [Bacillus sp. (in: firmicutes)]